jgi:hypothetical protein
MSQSAEYRQSAAECQQRATKLIDPLDKQQWRKIAEHWLKLAEAVDQDEDG